MDIDNERLTNLEKQMDETREVVLLFEDKNTRMQNTLQRQEEAFRNIQAEANNENATETEALNQRLNVAETKLARQSPILVNARLTNLENQIRPLNPPTPLREDIETLQGRQRQQFEAHRNILARVTRTQSLTNQRLDVIERTLLDIPVYIRNLTSGIKFLLESNPNFTNTPEYTELARTFNVINRHSGGKRKKTRKKRGKKRRKTRKNK